MVGGYGIERVGAYRKETLVESIGTRAWPIWGWGREGNGDRPLCAVGRESGLMARSGA